MASVAEVLIGTLIRTGVRRIYGLPGDSLNGLTDALSKHHEIQWVHVRHEETAAFAAGAEAHLTDQLAVCAGSCGPGNLHFINGLFDCHRSRVPVLAIASQIPTAEIGSEYFQETHPESIFKDCCHYCGVITESSHMPRLLSIAIRTAIAVRGVAVLVLPGNIAVTECLSEAITPGFSSNRSIIIPPKDELEKAAGLLNDAKRVTILAGAGCAGSHDSLIEIAEKLQAPIVHAFRGKEYVEFDNPYDVGMTGLLGFSSGYRAMTHCDLLLILGSDFPYRQFYPDKARIIQVDIRGEQIGRRAAIDVGLIGTVKETIASLLPFLLFEKDSEHLLESRAHYQETRKDLDALATEIPGASPMHPEYVTRVVDAMAATDAVFTVDVGTPSIWAARYLRFNGQRQLIGSWNHGSMACALPQAIGAQAAFKGRQVISLSGDGGLSMMLGELLTAVQNKLPVKVILYNNHALAFVELEMLSAGFLPFGTELVNPDFSKVADACGLFGKRVTTPEHLKPALLEAFDYDGPALIEVLVYRRELSIPPTITAQQALGFSLFLTKAVVNGRGDEVIDLGKTNIWDRFVRGSR